MESALIGYLLGVGTVALVVKRGQEARSAVAWTARQVGWVSGRVSRAIGHASTTAREEYARARSEQLAATAREAAPPPVTERPRHLNGA